MAAQAGPQSPSSAFGTQQAVSGSGIIQCLWQTSRHSCFHPTCSARGRALGGLPDGGGSSKRDWRRRFFGQNFTRPRQGGIDVGTNIFPAQPVQKACAVHGEERLGVRTAENQVF